MRKILQIAFIALLPVLCLSWLSADANAGIEQLLLEKVPVPQKRPADRNSSVVEKHLTLAPYAAKDIRPLPGTLKDGLKALSGGDGRQALRIHSHLGANSLDRKILGWSIALSGEEGIHSSNIVELMRGFEDWPGQKTMLRRAEEAFADENPGARQVIQAFAGRTPLTLEGSLLLAKAQLRLGDMAGARQAIQPFWHAKRLTKTEEAKVLSAVGSVLTVHDHRKRMHQMFYDGRVDAGKRMGALAKQYSLANAWAAVLRNQRNAKSLVDAVAPSSRQDAAYQFVRIEHERRKGNYKTAAKLLLAAPKNPKVLVDADEWWNERRIVSRQMLELGNAKLAYRLASEHAAQSPGKIAEAEFHAGWYALRWLKDGQKAQRHFRRLLEVTSQPISQSRGYYWLARASTGKDAENHYRHAASYSGAYYGQLAAAKLGIKKLSVSKPAPTDAERARFANRELVRAIKRLEESGYAWRADIIYRHLARTLTNSGELAILSARAERRGNHTLGLQIGKIAKARGLAVDSLAWPIGAIPRSAKPGRVGLPLSYAIARQESAFDVDARSSANARGLLQLLPGTAKSMARKRGLKYSSRRLSSDGGYNVTLGAAYLGEQLNDFNQSYILTFAAYNAGPRRAQEWVARFGNPKGKPLDAVVDWVELIPFTETRNYVQRVMENYQVYKARLKGGRLSIVEDLTIGRR